MDPAAEIPLTDKPPFTPRLKFDAGIQYIAPLGGMGSLTPRIDWLYLAEQYASAQNGLLNRIPAYGLTNVHLTYRDSKGDWEVALEGRNIFNRYYFTNIAGGALTSDPAQTQTAYPGAPREYAVTVRRTL